MANFPNDHFQSLKELLRPTEELFASYCIRLALMQASHSTSLVSSLCPYASQEKDALPGSENVTAGCVGAKIRTFVDLGLVPGYTQPRTVIFG